MTMTGVANRGESSNDLVTKTLVGKLEDEVADRTRELAAANHDLEKSNTRVLKQSAAQLKHSAMMSHEIRTPLNCIIGVSSLLLGKGMDATQYDYLRTINNSGDVLKATSVSRRAAPESNNKSQFWRSLFPRFNFRKRTSEENRKRNKELLYVGTAL
jgi:nitrogen-specific signal transduction histidine kinase